MDCKKSNCVNLIFNVQKYFMRLKTLSQCPEVRVGDSIMHMFDFN